MVRERQIAYNKLRSILIVFGNILFIISIAICISVSFFFLFLFSTIRCVRFFISQWNYGRCGGVFNGHSSRMKYFTSFSMYFNYIALFRSQVSIVRKQTRHPTHNILTILVQFFYFFISFNLKQYFKKYFRIKINTNIFIKMRMENLFVGRKQPVHQAWISK